MRINDDATEYSMKTSFSIQIFCCHSPSCYKLRRSSKTASKGRIEISLAFPGGCGGNHSSNAVLYRQNLEQQASLAYIQYRSVSSIIGPFSTICSYKCAAVVWHSGVKGWANSADLPQVSIMDPFGPPSFHSVLPYCMVNTNFTFHAHANIYSIISKGCSNGSSCL